MVEVLKNFATTLTIVAFLFTVVVRIYNVYKSSHAEMKIETTVERLTRTILNISAYYLFICLCIYFPVVLVNGNDIIHTILSDPKELEQLALFASVLFILVILIYWLASETFFKLYQSFGYIKKEIKGHQRKVYIKRNINGELFYGYYYVDQIKIDFIFNIENEALFIESGEEVKKRRITEIGAFVADLKNSLFLRTIFFVGAIFLTVLIWNAFGLISIFLSGIFYFYGVKYVLKNYSEYKKMDQDKSSKSMNKLL